MIPVYAMICFADTQTFR